MEKTINLIIKRPVSIREKVYSAVRDDIVNGRLHPGERIIESRIAQEIKTSRTPVREALHILEREGLLEAIPRVGYRVKETKWEDVEQICEIRIVNETLAACWAIDRVTPREIASLESNLTKSADEIHKGRPQSFVEHDAEFHEMLALASGSTHLLELCQMLRRHMLRYRMQSLYLEESAIRAIKGHQSILNSLKNKDKPGVSTAIRKHLEWVKSDIRENVFCEPMKISAGKAEAIEGKNA
jgi:DNA-binding GntR family transcriptional regulator